MGKGTTRTVIDRDRRAPDDRAARAHEHEHVAPSDPRTVLGNRAARMLLVQPKLVVGASNDALEIEADRVAAEVVRTIAAGPIAGQTDHECGDGCATHGSARTAARAIRRVSGHRCGDGCAVHGSARTIRRHAGHDHHDHPDVAPIGAAGGDVHAADEAAVNRARGGGAALPADFRASVEPVMGADFSGVRVHTGSSSAQLNRSFGASAFTIGNDIFFRDGMPDVSTREGAHLVSHELTHTVQQRGVPSVARCSCGATNPHIQRHSSFEHLMLGNVKPEDLARVGAWQDAIKQTESKRSGLKKTRATEVAVVDVDLGGPQPLQIDKSQILHVLMQEMMRLKDWQNDPPKESSAEQSNQIGQRIKPLGPDPDFGVVTVMLPQGILCTYGEMNTLGDYYGSVEVLRGAAPKAVWQLLQSVRAETWGFLRSTFGKVSASLTATERQNPVAQQARGDFFNEVTLPEALGDNPTTFEGATAFTISAKGGQAELLFGIQSTGAQGATNKYGTSLGRNACHFVPESWNAWAKNHDDARKLAAKAHRLRLESEQARTQLAIAAPHARSGLRDLFEYKKAEASKWANEALMTNGFGDHFLQDSYAAGHLINKTQIMQFYIEYIDSKDKWDYFTDANWRKVQNIAYTQTLAPPTQYDQSRIEGYSGATGPNANKGMDPQTVENRAHQDWQDNFKDVGLKVPPSLASPAGTTTRAIVDWFQAQARRGKTSAKGSQIEAAIGGAPQVVRMAVGDLVLDGVLLTSDGVAKRGQKMAEMRDSRAAAGGGLAGGGRAGAGEQLERAKYLKQTFRIRDELRPKKGSVAVATTELDIQKGFAAVTYNDYLEFIQSSFLQKSTNALHDVFCAKGLTVYDAAGGDIGKVYGDDSMFNANSSMGVAHSGATSQMSRDAIISLINTGNDTIPVKSIVDRFPRQVGVDVRGTIVKTPFEDWHNPAGGGALKKQANDKIFKSMDWSLLQKAGPGMLKDLGTFFTAPPPHNPF